jgi:hypothetical protein
MPPNAPPKWSLNSSPLISIFGEIVAAEVLVKTIESHATHWSNPAVRHEYPLDDADGLMSPHTQRSKSLSFTSPASNDPPPRERVSEKDRCED